MGALDGKHALITGGGSGIGAAIARTLAQAGAAVARLDALPRGKEHPVLQELLRGDMSRYGNDHHHADWVLLMKLLHWTGDDISLTKSIFLSSPLGRRAKAQEPETEGRRGNTNYVDRTIERIRKKRWNPPQRR